MTSAIMSTPASVSLSTMTQVKPSRVQDSAQQFEALMIGQMLRSVHEASQDTDSDTPGETMLDLANQQFSTLLAKNGGMGLAKMIVKGLER